jgi:hypothetical protein
MAISDCFVFYWAGNILYLINDVTFLFSLYEFVKVAYARHVAIV